MRRRKQPFDFDCFVEMLTSSVYKLADKRLGALIILEHQDNLDKYAEQGTLLNARFSSALLETIFTEHSPLGCGAVLIRNTTVLAAGAILPLANASDGMNLRGTRHLAALGISQKSDAIAIVASQETGKVSLSRDGMIVSTKQERFMGIIRAVFYQTPQSSKAKVSFRQWIGV